jgi:micrococcal nuclease
MATKESLNYTYYAEVIELAHDGDTIRLDVDLGYDAHIHKNIRLENINAAELDDKNPDVKKEAFAARDYLRKLLPIGTKVVVKTEKFRESFIRYVGFIYLQDGTDIGKSMVNAGHAVIVLVDK